MRVRQPTEIAAPEAPVAGSLWRESSGRVGWLLAGLLVGLGVSVSACGGPDGIAGYGPYPATLPSASTLCPTLAEVDYYVSVPPSVASGIIEKSMTAGVESTVRCVYGNLGQQPRRAVSVEMVLRPSATETRPPGVVITRVKRLGLWMISYRRRDLFSVVVHQGGVDVIVTSAAPRAELEGLAEEELSRIPETDRA